MRCSEVLPHGHCHHALAAIDPPRGCAAAIPALESGLQSAQPVGRVAELGSLIHFAPMPDYPLQVATFQDALARLPAVHEVGSRIHCLRGVTSEVLSSVDFGHFPHAAIRWAGG